MHSVVTSFGFIIVIVVIVVVVVVGGGGGRKYKIYKNKKCQNVSVLCCVGV